MTKHFILSLDPNAKYEWDRCSLRDPITADRPALAELIATVVGAQPGSYLVAVNIDVQVLEQAIQPQPVALNLPELPARQALQHLTELVA